MRSVATGRTPVPICKPEGICVCCDDCAPGWRRFWYSRSSNTARERLKPLVLTLARLLEITSICVCCASRPVFDIQSERIMMNFLSGLCLDDTLRPCAHDHRSKTHGKTIQFTISERRPSLGMDPGDQPEILSRVLACLALSPAVCSSFICMSNWRASVIMSTIDSTMFTLLLSILPEVTVTLASASAGLPSLVRNRASSPRTNWPSGGLVSL